MRRFALQRSLALLLVLLTMTAVIFLLRQVVPGDPARVAVGPNAPAAAVEAKRHELGLDRPLLVQYGRYLSALGHGDLGESVRTRRLVRSDLADSLPASVELVLAAVLIATLLGPGLALTLVLVPRAGALRHVMSAGASAPLFLSGLLLLYLLWFKVKALPGGGRSSFDDAPAGPTHLLVIDGLLAGRPLVAWDAVQHLVLPALTLALPMAVAVGRSLRSSLVGVLRQDHVRTARSKGLTEGQVLRRHALRNAATGPLAMAGLQVGLLIANLLIVERIFAWPGIGLYTVQALGSADLTAVLGVALVTGAAYVCINAVVDLCQALADPRVSLE